MLLIIFFHRRTIVLQYCVGPCRPHESATGIALCCNAVLVSTAQQSESATCVHPSPLVLDFIPLQVTAGHRLEFPALSSGFSLAIYFIHSIVSIHVSIPTSQRPPPFPLGVHPFVLYRCVSASALQIRSSIPSF